MRLIKPESLNLLTRTYQVRNRDRLAVTILAAFSLDGSGRLLDEADVWTAAGTSLPDGAMLDAMFPKIRGEFLAAGQACSPGGKPVSALQVKIRVGPLSKTLDVMGDREWTAVMGDFVTLGRPAPFSRIPLAWDRAYGGPGYSHNPLGKGYTGKMDRAHDRLPAPNIEFPDRLVASVQDQPEPASFLPLDPAWPQRARHGGTFNGSWLRDRWPGLPDDFDWAYFNAAPEDQRLKGFFRGDEPLIMENLHPERGLIDAALPGLTARCFAVRSIGRDESVEELALNLDTVWLFPNLLTGVLIWRGTAGAADEEASDIRTISAGIEPLDGPRLPVEAYFTAPEPEPVPTPPRPAMPSAPPVTEPAPAQVEEPPVPDPDLAKIQGMLSQIEAEEKEALAELKRLGVDPEQVMPGLREEIARLTQKPSSAPTSVTDLEQALAVSENEIRNLCLSLGFDIDAPQSLPADLSVPDPRTLKDLAAGMRKAGLIDPETAAHMAQMQDESEAAEHRIRELLEAESAEPETAPQAEIKPPARPRETLTRALVASAKAEGRVLAGEDLTGLDLSGLDLSGLNLSGIIAPGVNLTGAVLIKANLSEAVLSEARLNGADLKGANLAGATLQQAEAERAVLAGAGLEGADLTGVNLREADLTGACLAGSLLARADLSRACLRSADLRRTDLTEANLTEADLEGGQAERADFSGALLDKARLLNLTATASYWYGAHGTETLLTGSNLSGSRADENTRLPGADFRQADLSRSNWDGADLSGAVLAHANLDKASFSKTRLASANLYRATARQARLDHADLSHASLVSVNLFQGDLTRTNLRQADLRGANLHEAEFLHANITGADLTDALLTRTKLEGWKRPMNPQDLVTAAKQGRIIRQVDLSGLDLAGLDLAGAVWESVTLANTRLDGAMLAGARLTGCDFTGTNLAHADLSKADLTGSDFTRANLTRSDLAGATVTQARFVEARLIEADAEGLDFRTAVLDKTNLTRTDLSKTNLSGLKLSSWILTDADLRAAVCQNADFSSADLSRIDFRDADLSRATFNHVRAAYGHFDGADLSAAKFGHADLTGSSFDQAVLPEADFSHAVLSRCLLTGARCRSARFVRADLTFSDFSHADLTLADLSHARLASARFHRIKDQYTLWEGTDRRRASWTDPVLALAEDWRPVY